MKVNAQGFYTAVGRRKTATARVRIKAGSGKITVNNSESLQYFKKKILQMDLEQPLELTGNTGKFDIFVNVRGGGLSGQAGATRLGISRALIIFDENFKRTLRATGMLTRDSRQKERKKYGLAKARKRFQFSKR
ncbi:MAG: 30S ribosomal protein S9 [Candidatus Delongbacteria bacterium]|nr:30S ribosomal protein S9 [Candidatus Delongbacteria bacterium]MCG2759738.1 30S ribosomal protein S9 [Candidatus Delongbacteria bacterium]